MARLGTNKKKRRERYAKTEDRIDARRRKSYALKKSTNYKWVGEAPLPTHDRHSGNVRCMTAFIAFRVIPLDLEAGHLTVRLSSGYPVVSQEVLDRGQISIGAAVTIAGDPDSLKFIRGLQSTPHRPQPCGRINPQAEAAVYWPGFVCRLEAGAAAVAATAVGVGALSPSVQYSTMFQSTPLSDETFLSNSIVASLLP